MGLWEVDLKARTFLIGILLAVGVIAFAPPAQTSTPTCFGKPATTTGPTGTTGTT